MQEFQKRLVILVSAAAAAVLVFVILVTLVFPGFLQPRRKTELKAAVKQDLFHGLQTGDFTRLKESAEKAAERNRSETVFWAARVYAEIHLGNWDTAFTLGEKYLEDSEYESLLSYIYLSRGALNLDVEKESRRNLILSEYGSRDPVVFERIARMLSDPRLNTNAALLWAAQGEMDKAYTVIRETDSSSLHPLLPFFFALDAGNYGDALTILAEKRVRNEVTQAEADMLEGDVLLWLNDLEGAASIYSAYLETPAAPASTPFLNSAWVAAKRGDFNQAVEYLENGETRFSGEVRLILPRAAYLHQGGWTSEAMEVLARFLESYPDEAAGTLYSLTMPDLIENQARHEAALWQMLSRHPDYLKAARYFAAYSYREANWKDLETLLSRYEFDGSSKEWRSYMKGCYAAAVGDRKAAEELFLESLAEVQRWETHYNLALLQSYSRDFTSSLDHFQNADRLLIDTGRDDVAPERSLIRTGIARLMAEQGNPQGAIREILYALEIDPDNFKARLLLKKLKGR